MNRRGWIWVIAALVSFQASDFTLRLASVHTHFAVGTVLQSAPLMIVSVIVALRYKRKRRDRRYGGVWPKAAAYGILQFFIGNLLFYMALQLGGLSIASPSVQSQAIWAVLLGGLLLREKISRVMMAGVLLFFAGLVTISWFKSQGAGLEDGWPWAFACGILGGLAWAAGAAIQSAQLRKGVPLSYMLAIGSISGVLTLNLIIMLYYGAAVWADTGVWGACKVLAAGCFTGLAIASVSQALKTIELSKLIPVVSLSIVFNTIIGRLWFDEYVNFGSVVGMLIAFLGVVIVQDLKFNQLFKGARA